MSPPGILYSFRRCPYAIRARLALASAQVGADVREVVLRAKPPELLRASAKGTVPVWLPPGGTVVDESLAILFWCLEHHPLGHGGRHVLGEETASALIAECDGPFKHHLDGFRYGADERQVHRQEALAILRRWNTELEGMGAADPSPPQRLEPLGWALLPFLRQFRGSDPLGFDQASGLAGLQAWLARFEASPALAEVMQPPWAFRHPWRSPSWLYHLALEDDWQEARRQGHYLQSTRGKSFEEVGFVHASWSHQVESTWRRFYGDGPELRLLVIDPDLLAAAAIPLRSEPAPEGDELFPHIYGPLPTEAVLLAERFAPGTPSP